MKKTISILLSLISLSSYGSTSLYLSFIAKTNVPGVKIIGKSKKKFPINLTKKGNLKIPLDSLTTDMDIRDQHMKDEVFKNKDIRVSYANPLKCIKMKKCKLLLALKINNKVKKMYLNIKKDKNQLKGKAKLNLKDFGINPPKKFGVRVLPEVTVEFNVSS